MKTEKLFGWITFWLFITAIFSSAALAAPVLWGIDEDDGQLFSINDYTTLSGFTDYGQLKYNDNGEIRNIGAHIGSFVIDVDGWSYFVRNRDVGDFDRPVLMRFNTTSASTTMDNIVDIVATLDLAFDDGSDNITGLTFDPFSGQLYGLFRDSGDSPVDKLLIIDKNTGDVQVVGEIQNDDESARSAEDMVFDEFGNLYVTDDHDDHLYLVDKTSGTILSVVDDEEEDGIDDSVKIEALEWDWMNDVLIGFDDNNNEFVQFTLGDGNNSIIGEISSLTDVEGIAFTTVPIPGAVWLFASGLIGLVMIRRKTKDRK